MRCHTTPSPSGGFYAKNNQRRRVGKDSPEKPINYLSPSPSLLITPVSEELSKKAETYKANQTRVLEEVETYPMAEQEISKRIEILRKSKANLKIRDQPENMKLFKHAPSLVNSFSSVLPPPKAGVRLLVERCDKSCQSDSVLMKRPFENLSEYQMWIDGEVEPFVKVSYIYMSISVAPDRSQSLLGRLLFVLNQKTLCPIYQIIAIPWL